MFVFLGTLLFTAFSFVHGDPKIALKLFQNQISCFQNDVSSNALTQIFYKLEALPFDKRERLPKDALQLQVEVYDPEHSLILSREYTDFGKVHYTSDRAGIHKVCISPTTNFVNKKTQVKVFLDIQNIGAANYTAVALAEKYTVMQLEIRRALDSLDLITRWHDYMVKRESRFRQTTNAISWKIFVISPIQIVLLLLVGYWQVQTLKNYFIAKKLV
uniref:GOLD domain-containing protein n=1 Tax=Mesocestoides corti TaxID=53468 RepID=A0A5K3ETJ6_MESCO